MNYNYNKYSILDLINTPKELRQLSENNLQKLCNELREFLLISVSKSSGHFASGLGVIELTVALHYVYNTPFDYLIWDVGHQAYPHKILTGRREHIFTIRQRNGLHSFPCRDESEYDVLSVGHSSTSISAGLGLAVAAEREMLGRRTVCVIGDGAITAGMAFEAINHAGIIKSDLLVILNDNNMSISENVGSLNNYRIKKQTYLPSKLKLKKTILKKFIIIKNFVKYIQTKNKKKYLNTSVELFSKLGFNCTGPINGHNVLELIRNLKNIRNMKGPQFLHIITKKGYGYKPAEKDPIKWHSVPKFDPKIGILPHNNTNSMTYSDIFGDWLCQTATQDNKLIGITPAMKEGSGMNIFSQKYPKQYFDVAIAEQHAVTFAAGLSIAGYKPVVAIYSTFLQRAYDQIIHDIAIQNLPVLFAIDRGGIVGSDGQTHQGAFDLSFLRCIPNLMIMTPSNAYECKLMLYTGYHYTKGPSVVRYPKGYALHNKSDNFETSYSLYSLPISKGIIHRHGNHIAILNFGTLFQSAYNVALKLNATLVDMRFVKPLDETLIKYLANNHQALITIEENAIIGGAGSGVNELLMKNKLLLPILNIGLPDFFIPQGSQKEILSELGLDSIGIYKKIIQWI